jgi:cytochrome c oxidase cbb3-type subunit I/II
VAQADVDKQATTIAEGLSKNGIKVSKNKEIIAVIAYLQRLGKDIKNMPKTAEVK